MSQTVLETATSELTRTVFIMADTNNRNRKEKEKVKVKVKEGEKRKTELLSTYVSTSILLPTNRQERKREEIVDQPKNEGVIGGIELMKINQEDEEANVFDDRMKKTRKPRVNVEEKPGTTYVSTSILLPTRARNQADDGQKGVNSSKIAMMNPIYSTDQDGTEIISSFVAPNSSNWPSSDQREQRLDSSAATQHGMELEPRTTRSRNTGRLITPANRRIHDLSVMLRSPAVRQNSLNETPDTANGLRNVK